MIKFTNAAAAALVLVAALGPVPAVAKSVTVSIADIDLATAKGRKALDRRIAAASALVCDRGGAHLDPAVRRSVRECVDATIDAMRLRAERKASLQVAAR